MSNIIEVDFKNRVKLKRGKISPELKGSSSCKLTPVDYVLWNEFGIITPESLEGLKSFINYLNGEDDE